MTPDSIAAESNYFDSEPQLGCNYNAPKLLFSLAQVIWACFTLYRARGDQIEEYGIVAFGLTVAPYACMSIINTDASLVAPKYPSIFLVRTPIMDGAEAEGGYFSGKIQVKIDPDSEVMPYNSSKYFFGYGSLNLAFWFALTPLIIIGGLSGFQPPKRTSILH